jgi:hypothetical protein
MALSARHFPEAESRSQHALELAGGEDKFVAAQGKYLLGLARALGGHAAAGLALCQEAQDIAVAVGDPMMLAKAQLALAEVGLINNDPRRALDSALPAQKFCASSGLQESIWRASLLAGLASLKMNDPGNARVFFTSASEGLSSLQQKWGEETFKNYVTRADIQLYRKQLEQNAAGR